MAADPDRIHRIRHGREAGEMRTLGVIGSGIEPLPASWTLDDGRHEYL